MTVAELIEKLWDQDPGAEVLLVYGSVGSTITAVRQDGDTVYLESPQ